MKKSRWIHLVARTHRGLRPFENREQGLALWRSLRRRFPERVIAAILMPNHLHLVVETGRPMAVRHALACLLRGYTRGHYPGESLWEALPPPDEIQDRTKLKTVIRYVHLNPCRGRRTDDPWDWEFSTLRDHGGLALEPWVQLERVADIFGTTVSAWREEHVTWLFRDDFVAPDVREKRMSPPDLRTLDPREIRRVLEWATLSTSGELERRGGAKDELARLWMHLNPEVPLLEAERELGIKRERLAQLRSRPFSIGELRAFESVALSVRSARISTSQSLRRGQISEAVPTILTQNLL